MKTPHSVERTEEAQQASPPFRATGGNAPPPEEASGEGARRAPHWVPYTPPPPSRWARLRKAIGRYGFVVVCLLLAAGLVAFLQVLPQLHSGRSAAGQAAAPGNPLAGRTTGATPPSGPEAMDSPYEGLAHLRVSTQPSGATVVLGRDTLGTTPLQSIAVPAGVHVLSIYTAAGAPVDTVITLKQGATPHLTFALNPDSQVPNPNSQFSNPQPATRNPQPAARNRQPETPNPQFSQTGALRLTSAPSGATVLIDGKRVGTTPMVASEVAAGMHTVTFRMEGFAPDQANVVRVTPQQPSLVRGDLTLLRGTLHVLARPWGSIYIDGDLKVQSTDLWHTMRLAPGSHTIKAVHPALGVKTYVVQLNPGEEQSVVLDLTK